MKFQFKIQDFQTEAAESIVRVFAGQPKSGLDSYRRDIGSEKSLSENEKLDRRGHVPVSYVGLSDAEKQQVEEEYETAYRNPEVALNKEQLLKNIRAVQTDKNIK
jgi:type III restriction enzyme